MSLLIAMLVDWLVGEPPASLHPVVWLGKYLGWVGRPLTKLRPLFAFLAGTACWLLGATLFVGLYAYLSLHIEALPSWLAWLLLGLLLKPLMALRVLLKEVSAVEVALATGLEPGRRQLSRIVSRDTSRLSEAEVRESALESLSENLSDSLVAPLFWFMLFGLPGAALYRFANTADAMWGYRGSWEWAGKWAALFDDVLNYIPAKLTACALLCLTSRGRARIRTLGPEASRTPSPNSGWPMAALALSHGIRLGKPGVYVLNPTGGVPSSSLFRACLHHVHLTGWLAALSLAVLSELLGRLLHG